MSMRNLLLGTTAAGIALLMWGCQFGIGPRLGGHRPRHTTHNVHHRPPVDQYQVQYQPFETIKTVKCPVCGGAGTLQKPYIAHPVPFRQQVRP